MSHQSRLALDGARAVRYTQMMEVRKVFNRHRFVVDVEVDDSAYLEQAPLVTRDPQQALASEIRSNLESLPGIRTVSVQLNPLDS